MNIIGSLLKLGAAQEVLEKAQEKRRADTRDALVLALRSAQCGPGLSSSADSLADQHLDAILAAASQRAGVGAALEKLGVKEWAKGLIDRL